MSKSLLSVMALAMTSALAAQTVQTFPNPLPSSYAGNSWPFNNTSATGFRTQFVYDGSLLGVNYPVLIQRMRFTRSSVTSTTTGLLHNVTISLSTSPVAWNALTTTFANHVGNDVKVIFQGNLSVNATQWYVDLQLSTPFLYDPTAGALCFDFVRGTTTNTNTYPGSGGYTSGTAAAPFKANRLFGDPSSPTGSLDSASSQANGYANVCEVTFIPASGLYSGFSATPVSGSSPLKVQFTDQTFTSAPGGVTTWAWDFDNDNQVDSTVQNPQWTYTATGFDKKFTVSLTTTDGVHPASKLTKPDFIVVNPSTAKSEDFGKGSVNMAVPSPIDPSPFSSIYSSTAAVRGFYFTAPTNFVINGFEVPNDYSPPETDQTIVCYIMKTAPTGAYAATAADVKFFATGPANTILRPTPPILVQQGDWVGVMGACHAAAASSSMRNSYGAANTYTSSVLGQPITLNRLWMNADVRTNMGVGTINPSTGTVSRVFIHVPGNTSTDVPTLTSSARPILGTTPNLEFDGKIATAQGGILFLTPGRLPAAIPTPFGDLLVVPTLLLTVPVPGGKGSIPFPIPNLPGLTGASVAWQGFAFDITGGFYGMSNGTDWYVGSN